MRYLVIFFLFFGCANFLQKSTSVKSKPILGIGSIYIVDESSSPMESINSIDMTLKRNNFERKDDHEVLVKELKKIKSLLVSSKSDNKLEIHYKVKGKVPYWKVASFVTLTIIPYWENIEVTYSIKNKDKILFQNSYNYYSAMSVFLTPFVIIPGYSEGKVRDEIFNRFLEEANLSK